MNKKILLFTILSILLVKLSAQPSLDYWNNVRYFKITGGTVTPGPELSSTSEDGLFAQNGYQIGFDYNYMIAMGFGLGVNLEFDRFYFDELAFLEYAQPDMYRIGSGYSSAKFGLNALFNIPIIVSPEMFTFNLYVEGNAGLRGMSIPSIDLYYDEVVNNFVEVSYRARSNTMGYLGYSAGVQLLFANKFGINVSYNAVVPSRHSIRYSVRKFDAAEELYESEGYANNFLDHTGLQFGILFMLGK